MDRRPGMKFRSDVNRKSKTCPFDKLLRADSKPSRTIENRKWVRLVAIAVAFALCGAVAEAQQAKKIPRIGYLAAGNAAGESARADAIRLALRERGYIEGQNIAIEFRYSEGKLGRNPELAAELVPLKVDIILVTGSVRLIQAAKNATKTIPIVMMGGEIDPVEAGLVESGAASRRQRHRHYTPFPRTRR